MTSHLSNATTARDHKLTIPATTEKKNGIRVWLNHLISECKNKFCSHFFYMNYSDELQQANTEALK